MDRGPQLRLAIPARGGAHTLVCALCGHRVGIGVSPVPGDASRALALADAAFHVPPLAFLRIGPMTLTRLQAGPPPGPSASAAGWDRAATLRGPATAPRDAGSGHGG